MYLTVRDRPGAVPGTPGTGAARPAVATTVLLLGTVSLLTDVSSEMVAAVLPLYLTTQMGLSLLAYGFIDGLYQGVSAAVRLTGGYLSDRAGKAKLVATFGYGVSALSRLGLLVAHGMGGITAAITADRLGKGLRTAPRDAMIAAASPPGQLGRSFGVHRTMDTAGAALGPLLAFALLAAIPGDYSPVFVVSLAFAVVGVAVIALFVRDQAATGAVAGPGLREVLREVTDIRLRRPLLAVALLSLLAVGDGFIYLALQQRDQFAAAVFPLLYVGTNLAYLALALPLGRLSDRVGKIAVFLVGYLVLAGAFLVAAGPFTGLGAILGCLALLGTFYAATDGVLAALMSTITPARMRGSGIAAAQTVVAASRFCSSLLMGALFFAVGPSGALALAALALGAAVPADPVRGGVPGRAGRRRRLRDQRLRPR